MRSYRGGGLAEWGILDGVESGSEPTVWSHRGSSQGRRVDWKRGRVSEFGRRSRRRCLNLLNSVDRDRVPLGECTFWGLTYPGDYPGDPQAWKRDLAAFRRRLERAFGGGAGRGTGSQGTRIYETCNEVKSSLGGLVTFWKLEPQERGAPHFHLLILGIDPAKVLGGMQGLRRWASQAWYECVGSGDERHLAAGTNVESVRSWRGVISYAGKYMGKHVAGFVDKPTGELLPVGRWWGIWRRNLLPITAQVTRLHERGVVQFRRAVRRLVRAQQRAKRAMILARTGKRGQGGGVAWLRGAIRGRASAYLPVGAADRIAEWARSVGEYG